MSGYTPLFDVTKGTLCGKWPDIGLWPIVLAMADKNGLIDVTPLFISSVTGLPLPEVIACMKRFCEPDPYSRSPDNDGRRLVLADDHRDWGWYAVNHAHYREKARLMAKNAREVSSGYNAERLQDRRRPPLTAADPLSNANANTYSNSKNTTAAEFLDFKLAYPERAGGQPWGRAKKAISARLDDGSTWTEMVDGAKRYAAYCAATQKLGTEYVMHAATFCGPEKHYLQSWELPATKADARLTANLSAAEEFMRKTG